MRVAVARASTQDTALAAIAPEGTDIRRFDDDASAMQALMSGQVDALGCATTIAQQIDKRTNGEYENKLVLRQQYMAPAMRLGQTDLLKGVDAFVGKYVDNGERRLARLEERLGARLLRRTTRSLVLTEVGEVFYRQACAALEAVRLAEQSVRKSDEVGRGDLRVSIPPMMDTSFHAMLCEFAASHPALRMHVHTSSQHVDVLHDG